MGHSVVDSTGAETEVCDDNDDDDDDDSEFADSAIILSRSSESEAPDTGYVQSK